jgi:protein SCO1/2
MSKRSARMAITCLLALTVWAGCNDDSSAPLEGFRGEPVEGQPPVPQLALRDQHGELFSMADQAGRLVLIFFGFVHCPDVCPATLSSWARILDELGPQANSVRCVFISVDPKRDTPERLAQHLEIYGSEFVGLVGSESELAPVYQDFGVYREEVRFGQGDGSYVVDHTTTMLLVDGQGRQRFRYEFNTPVDDIVHDLRLLLP